MRRRFFEQLIFAAFTRVKVAVEAPFSGPSSSGQRRQGSTLGSRMIEVAACIPAFLKILAGLLEILSSLIHISLYDHGSFRLILRLRLGYQ